MATINKFGTSSLRETIQQVLDENEDDSSMGANGNPITNLGDPVNDNDAATKSYVDTSLNGYLSRFGATSQGDILLSVGTDAVRSLGCKDIIATKEFKLYLGDTSNYINYTPNFLAINSSAGILFTDNGNNVMSTGISNSNFDVYFYHHVNMSQYKISNMANPTVDQDATTKVYVDDKNNLKVSKSGDTLSGNIDMSGNRITGLPTNILDASSDRDAVSKKIMVDVAAGLQSNALQRAGDSMNGQIDMNSNKIVNLADPTSGQDAVSKYYVDTALNGYLSKFGTTAQGDLMVSIAADTIRNIGCNNINASKTLRLYVGDINNFFQYGVDSLTLNTSAGILVKQGTNNVMSIGNSTSDPSAHFYQDIKMEQKYITNLHDPSSNQDASTKSYTDTADNLRVLKAGDTMSGTLNMSNSQITNLASPMNGGDASNKSYVDSKLIKSSSGVIHILATDYNNRDGTIVTCSQDYNSQYRAWQMSSQGLANGTNEFATVASPTFPVIVQIQLANAVPIWQIAVRGRIGASSAFTAWQLRGSVDGTTYVTLINSTQTLTSGVGSATPIYLIPVSPVNTNVFKYFQLYFTAANGTSSPGISYCQLYQYDTLC